jgi:hypothetical protein
MGAEIGSIVVLKGDFACNTDDLNSWFQDSLGGMYIVSTSISAAFFP